MPKHSEFILTPIDEILSEAGTAIGNQPRGIENYPLKEYFLQSVFLRLTGAQEQKCKCILWDVGTYDYNIRYRFFGSRGESVGECSTLNDKNKIFRALEECVRLSIDDPKRTKYINESSSAVEGFFDKCAPHGWPKQEFGEFEVIFQRVTKDNVYQLNPGKILKNTGNCNVEEIYNLSVYRHRNRCAHNLLSFQGNKPSLALMRSDEYKYWNYYLRYALILLIDKVMTNAYKQWREQVERGLYDE